MLHLKLMFLMLLRRLSGSETRNRGIVSKAVRRGFYFTFYTLRTSLYIIIIIYYKINFNINGVLSPTGERLETIPRFLVSDFDGRANDDGNEESRNRRLEGFVATSNTEYRRLTTQTNNNTYTQI